MKRFGLGCLAAIVCTGAVPAAAQASAAKIKGFVCQTAVIPAQRGMSIAAVMRPIPGTARMAMKFQLMRRTRRHGPSSSLAGPSLKTWLAPRNPTLGSRPGDTWVVKHPVVDLAAPAYYRFKVTFRWLDSSGGVIGQTDRRSPICFQPQRQPDLAVTQGWSSAAQPGRYAAVVRNRGATSSSKFNLQVTSDGMQLASSLNPLPSLGAHQEETVLLHGAACTPGQAVDITVNPTDPSADYDMADNTVTVTCPQPTAAPARTRRRR
jgi:hypothetical protein